MNNNLYDFKIRVSLREGCKDYENLNTGLIEFLSNSELVFLGNNEYGSNSWAVVSAIGDALRRQNWFFNNAKELLWFSALEGISDDPLSDDYYNVEDLLEMESKRRKGEWYP